MQSGHPSGRHACPCCPLVYDSTALNAARDEDIQAARGSTKRWNGMFLYITKDIFDLCLLAAVLKSVGDGMRHAELTNLARLFAANVVK